MGFFGRKKNHNNKGIVAKRETTHPLTSLSPPPSPPKKKQQQGGRKSKQNNNSKPSKSKRAKQTNLQKTKTNATELTEAHGIISHNNKKQSTTSLRSLRSSPSSSLSYLPPDPTISSSQQNPPSISSSDRSIESYVDEMTIDPHTDYFNFMDPEAPAAIEQEQEQNKAKSKTTKETKGTNVPVSDHAEKQVTATLDQYAPVAEEDTNETTRDLVKTFIGEIWNKGEIKSIPLVCSPSLRFNGHNGLERVGHEGFTNMVKTVRASFDDYHCAIHSMVVEDRKCFCRLTFTGRHTGHIMGFHPTNNLVSWGGASEFTVCPRRKQILKVWELGDIKTLEKQLQQR